VQRLAALGPRVRAALDDDHRVAELREAPREHRARRAADDDADVDVEALGHASPNQSGRASTRRPYTPTQ